MAEGAKSTERWILRALRLKLINNHSLNVLDGRLNSDICHIF